MLSPRQSAATTCGTVAMTLHQLRKRSKRTDGRQDACYPLCPGAFSSSVRSTGASSGRRCCAGSRPQQGGEPVVKASVFLLAASFSSFFRARVARVKPAVVVVLVSSIVRSFLGQ